MAKSTRLVAGAVAVAITMLGAAGCQQNEEADAGDGKLHIVLIGKTTDDHFALVRDGAMAAGDELGVDVEYKAPDSSNEGDRQLNMLETAVNAQPDGVGIAPQDGIQDSAPQVIEQAAEVPFVVFDTPLQRSDAPIVTITSDNKGIGAHLAEEMTKTLGGQGKVAIITNGILGTAAERRDGFTEWVEQNAPGVEVVAIQDGEADPAKSRDKAQGIMQAYPELDALVGTGIYATIAIADEVAARGADTKVFGVDVGPDALTQLKEGKITGIVAQNPYQIGYQMVETLVNAITGEAPAEKLVYTESAWITLENLDDPEIKTILGLE